MRYYILKGEHTSRPFAFGLFYNKRTLKREVVLGASCQYEIGMPDQLDWNKLFGIAHVPFWKFLLPWKLINSHHEYSVRFGWRYNTEKEAIEIGSYAYVNGKRMQESIIFLRTGQPYILSLVRQGNLYEFRITTQTGRKLTEQSIEYNCPYKWGYYLKFYFGGNQPAPHRIQALIKRR